MRVLVTWATKHGGTAEVGEAIAEELRTMGLDVTALPAEDAPPPDEFDAVVIGSGAYMGKWLKAALEYVGEHELSLRQRPVWLFTSGPIGDPPRPENDAVDIEATKMVTDARAHQLFPGRIDRKRLGFAERALVMALRVPDGDWRNWDDIRAWARGIGEELLKERRLDPAPVEYHPWEVGGRW